MKYYNPNLKSPARELRKNMTEAERLLWSKLRSKQLKNSQFYRQKVIGNYIVDFCCLKAKLVIEVDGSQHFIKDVLINDAIRDNYLRRTGFRVLRFTNNEILKNLVSVLNTIYEYL